jgi:cytochrome b involved in lipid metabolism
MVYHADFSCKLKLKLRVRTYLLSASSHSCSLPLLFLNLCIVDMAKVFDAAEVARHNTSDSCWVIIEQDGKKNVWDVTSFLPMHPGGSKIILKLAVSLTIVIFPLILTTFRAQIVPKSLTLYTLQGL